MVRLYLSLTIIAALMAAVWLVHRHGAQSALQSIHEVNHAASERADKSALDYDSCLDAGGLWNFGTGKCIRRSGRDRD